MTHYIVKDIYGEELERFEFLSLAQLFCHQYKVDPNDIEMIDDEEDGDYEYDV